MDSSQLSQDDSVLMSSKPGLTPSDEIAEDNLDLVRDRIGRPFIEFADPAEAQKFDEYRVGYHRYRLGLSKGAKGEATTVVSGGTQSRVPPFLTKLAAILDNATYKDYIDWTEDGQGIIVRSVEEFSKRVLPKFFKHSNFTSFLRQLNMYNFYTTAQKRGEWRVFTNPMFTRGNVHRAAEIRRKVSATGAPSIVSTTNSSNRTRTGDLAVMTATGNPGIAGVPMLNPSGKYSASFSATLAASANNVSSVLPMAIASNRSNTNLSKTSAQPSIGVGDVRPSPQAAAPSPPTTRGRASESSSNAAGTSSGKRSGSDKGSGGSDTDGGGTGGGGGRGTSSERSVASDSNFSFYRAVTTQDQQPTTGAGKGPLSVAGSSVGGVTTRIGSIMQQQQQQQRYASSTGPVPTAADALANQEGRIFTRLQAQAGVPQPPSGELPSRTPQPVVPAAAQRRSGTPPPPTHAPTQQALAHHAAAHATGQSFGGAGQNSMMTNDSGMMDGTTASDVSQESSVGRQGSTSSAAAGMGPVGAVQAMQGGGGNRGGQGPSQGLSQPPANSIHPGMVSGTSGHLGQAQGAVQGQTSYPRLMPAYMPQPQQIPPAQGTGVPVQEGGGTTYPPSGAAALAAMAGRTPVAPQPGVGNTLENTAKELLEKGDTKGLAHHLMKRQRTIDARLAYAEQQNQRLHQENEHVCSLLNELDVQQRALHDSATIIFDLLNTHGIASKHYTLVSPPEGASGVGGGGGGYSSNGGRGGQGQGGNSNSMHSIGGITAAGVGASIQRFQRQTQIRDEANSQARGAGGGASRQHSMPGGSGMQGRAMTPNPAGIQTRGRAAAAGVPSQVVHSQTGHMGGHASQVQLRQGGGHHIQSQSHSHSQGQGQGQQVPGQGQGGYMAPSMTGFDYSMGGTQSFSNWPENDDLLTRTPMTPYTGDSAAFPYPSTPGAHHVDGDRKRKRSKSGSNPEGMEYPGAGGDRGAPVGGDTSRFSGRFSGASPRATLDSMMMFETATNDWFLEGLAAGETPTPSDGHQGQGGGGQHSSHHSPSGGPMDAAEMSKWLR